MKKLILHIGTTKTGSTALQRFLYDNRKLLNKMGIGFPLFTKQPLTWNDTLRNGSFFALYCENKVNTPYPQRFSPNDVDKNLDTLKQSFQTYDTILLTDEYFSDICPILPGTSYQERNLTFWSVLRDEIDRLSIDQVHIVVYLRRQDHYRTTLWKQNVKTGYTDRSLKDFLYSDWANYRMDYALYLETLQSALKEKCILSPRPYEYSSFSGGDIFHDFCETAGIPWNDQFILPAKIQNPSVTYDVAEAIRVFTTDAPKSTNARDMLVSCSNKLSRQKPDPSNLHPLSEEERVKYLQHFEESNQQLSLKYNNGEPFFSEEVKDGPVWVPDQEWINYCRKQFQAKIDQYHRFQWFYDHNPIDFIKEWINSHFTTNQVDAIRRIVKR